MATKNILLIHGAWGDGSNWRLVVPLLAARRYNVTAVQLPLSSFDADVAKARTALAAQEGPTLLVGHSYGGSIISVLGNDPAVSGLVFISAYAPDSGESAASLNARNGPPPSGVFMTDADGYILVERPVFPGAFCQDLPEPDRQAMNAAQHPTHPSCLAGTVDEPAWRTKASWYFLSTKDRMVPPDLQRFMAERIIPRRIVEVPSGHASMVSYPYAAADLIDEAARSL